MRGVIREDDLRSDDYDDAPIPDADPYGEFVRVFHRFYDPEHDIPLASHRDMRLSQRSLMHEERRSRLVAAMPTCASGGLVRAAHVSRRPFIGAQLDVHLHPRDRTVPRRVARHPASRSSAPAFRSRASLAH
jgi:hypothetical protein